VKASRGNIPTAQLSPEQIRAAERAARRAQDIVVTASVIYANLTWGDAGPPWAEGKEAAAADRKQEVERVRAAWGETAVDEMRTRVRMMMNARR
jgi:precorrin-3B methylase